MIGVMLRSCMVNNYFDITICHTSDNSRISSHNSRKNKKQTNNEMNIIQRIPSVVKSSIMVSSSMFCGDALCQQVVGTNQWDYKRSLIMATTGFFVSGPISHTTIHILERFIPGNTRKASIQKVLCNTLLAPLHMSATFTTVTLLKGKSLSDAQQKIKRDLPLTYAAGGMYWPLVGYFNFRHTPIQYRPLVGSLAGVVWGIFMAGQVNKELPVTTTTEEIPIVTSTDGTTI
jgi:hypothetical protein